MAQRKPPSPAVAPVLIVLGLLMITATATLGSRGAAVTVAPPPSSGHSPFTDAIPAWSASAINRLAALGIIRGYDDGRFGAADPVTRGQAATLLQRILRQTGFVSPSPACSQTYVDVPSAHYAFPSLCALVQQGKIDAATHFYPDVPANRAEMAGFVYRAQGTMLLLETGVSEEEIRDAPAVFPDVPKSHRFFLSIGAMEKTGVMTGNPAGDFAPSDTLNRAQAAVVMDRLLTLLQPRGAPVSVPLPRSSSSVASLPSVPSSAAALSSPAFSSSRVPASSFRSSARSTALAPRGSSQRSEVGSRRMSATNVSGRAPDYAVWSVRLFPSPLPEGSSYAFTVTVQNTGSAAERRSFVRFDIDEGDDGAVDFPGVMFAVVDPLGSWQTKSITWSSAVVPPLLPWTPSPGTHRVIACADAERDGPEDRIGDRNEGNNCAETVFTVEDN